MELLFSRKNVREIPPSDILKKKKHGREGREKKIDWRKAELVGRPLPVRKLSWISLGKY